MHTVWKFESARYIDDRPQLFQVDPSGSSFDYSATAISKNYMNSKYFLGRRYNDSMELDDAVHIALLTLRKGYEGETTENSIEVAVVGEDGVSRSFAPTEANN